VFCVRLALGKRIVEVYRGRVWIESAGMEEGEQVRFYVAGRG
jgi:ferric-dicitrate binding protein FerR (iron transport regulator)